MNFQVYIRTHKYSFRYDLQGKTAMNTNSAPAKPDMNYDDEKDYENGYLVVKIMWIPCGKERVCDGKNSGTHFLIKYRYVPNIQW